MKTNRYIVIALLLSIFVSSCEDSFLKQDPQTSLSSEQVFEKPENVQAFVYGLYYQWRATRVNRKGFYTILGTDEAQQGEYQVRTNAMQAAFDKFLQHRSGISISWDRVHPGDTGSMIIARRLLEEMNIG